MRYTHSINAVKCIEWGITINQGALMDLINQASSWAEPTLLHGKLYFWMSRNKVISEIPLAYSKPDTVYRAFKTLAEKRLIDYTKDGKRDLVALTEKGKLWNVKGTIIGDAKLGNKSELGGNSEINPSKSGNKSEFNSEINPTNKNTSINKSTSNKNRGTSAPETIIPSDKQIRKMADYGINSDMLIESFLSNAEAKGLTYKNWNAAFTTWINNEIKFCKLIPVAERRFDITQEDWQNPNGPARYQQPDVYHPSHKSFDENKPAAGQPQIMVNGLMVPCLPGMNVEQSNAYIASHKMPGEMTDETYYRLFAELEEQGL